MQTSDSGRAAGNKRVCPVPRAGSHPHDSLFVYAWSSVLLTGSWDRTDADLSPYLALFISPPLSLHLLSCGEKNSES